MRDSVTVELGVAAWPGSTQRARLTVHDSIDVDEVRWAVGARFTSATGRSGTPANSRSSITVGRRLHCGDHIDIEISLPTQPTDLGDAPDELSVDWFLVVTVATTDGSGEIEIPSEIAPVPAPGAVPVEALVDTEAAATNLTRHRRRTPVTSGWVWVLAMPALAAAIGIPLGFSIGDGEDSNFIWSMALTISLWIAFALVAEVLYARADRHPFELDRSIIRRGTTVELTFATPTRQTMTASIVTRILQEKTQLSTSPGTNKVDLVTWKSGPLVEIGASQISAALPIAVDSMPTVSIPSMRVLRIEHWVRVQPASSIGSSLRFQRDRSDRPVMITT